MLEDVAFDIEPRDIAVDLRYFAVTGLVSIVCFLPATAVPEAKVRASRHRYVRQMVLPILPELA